MEDKNLITVDKKIFNETMMRFVGNPSLYTIHYDWGPSRKIQFYTDIKDIKGSIVGAIYIKNNESTCKIKKDLV